MPDAPLNAQEERMLASVVRQINNWEARPGVRFMDVPLEQFDRETLIKIVEICKQEADVNYKMIQAQMADLCPTHH